MIKNKEDFETSLEYSQEMLDKAIKNKNYDDASKIAEQIAKLTYVLNLIDKGLI